MSSVDKTASSAFCTDLTSAAVFVWQISVIPYVSTTVPVVIYCVKINVPARIYSRTCYELRGSQVHRLVSLRVTSLKLDFTECSDPGPVSIFHPYYKLRCWLFQGARAAGAHPSMPHVRVHRYVGCMLWFLLSIHLYWQHKHPWNFH